MAQFVSSQDTAKLVRRALTRAFPDTKFSVRQMRYPGGTSLRIKWVDGPTCLDVRKIVGQYEGASFDGQTDVQTVRSQQVGGETVYYLIDYINCERQYSAETMQAAIDEVANRFGTGRPEVAAKQDGTATFLVDTSTDIAPLTFTDYQQRVYALLEGYDS